MTDHADLGLPDVPADLDAAAVQRIRARIARLTEDSPDAEGRTPFAVLAPSSSGGSDLPSPDPAPPVALIPTLVPGESDAAYVSSSPPSRRRRGTWLVAAAVLLVVALAGTLLVRTTRQDDTHPTLAEVTHRLAEQPDVTLAPGQYWYYAKVTRGAAPAPLGDSVVWAVQWMAMDGSGAIGSAMRTVPAGEAPPDLSGDVTGDEAGPGEVTALGLSYAQLRDLPADPVALREASRPYLDGSDPDMEVQFFVELATFIVVPPATRAAALEVLIDYAGVTTSRADDLGFPDRVAIEGTFSFGNWLVLVDAETGVPIEGYYGYPTGSDGNPDLGGTQVREQYLPERIVDQLPT